MIDAFVSACSQPWAITPDALRTLLTIADRGGDIEALQRKAGDRLANTRQVTIRSNGVAVVPITGTIFRYANLFTDISGATSTQVLATDITTALDNPAVRAIVLDINSPGGQAEGIAELARAINAGTARKPITAYIGGMGASAAYWLAAAASDIVIDRTALVGSIGVVAAVRDERQKDERAGVRKAEIVSSASRRRRTLPTSKLVPSTQFDYSLSSSLPAEASCCEQARSAVASLPLRRTPEVPNCGTRLRIVQGEKKAA